MENAVKIKSYKVRNDGLRGLVISLPKAWTEDQDLEAGDVIEIYRDLADRLVIIPAKSK